MNITIPLPKLASLQQKVLLQNIPPHGKLNERDQQQIGECLFALCSEQWVLEGGDDLALHLKENADNASGLTLLLLEAAEIELQNYPWELLYHTSLGFLALNPWFHIIRKGSCSPKVSPAQEGPLKILLFTSLAENSAESGRLDLEQEQANVLEPLMAESQKGKVEILTSDDGSFDAFHDLVRKNHFDIIHLAGHGTYREGQAYFAFEKDERHELKSAQDIAVSLQDKSPKLIVLSACESGVDRPSNLNQGLATRLMQFAPHVIGMTDSIMDLAGLTFAEGLYSALSDGETIPKAIQLARIKIEQLTDEDASTTYMRRNQAQWSEAAVSRLNWSLPAHFSSEPEATFHDWRTYTGTERTLHNPQRTEDGHLFIGRRREQREIWPVLSQEQKRLIILTGLGGQGKTTLANRLCKRVQEQNYTLLEWKATGCDFKTTLEDDWLDLLDSDTQVNFQSLGWHNFAPKKKAKKFLKELQKLKPKLIFFLDNLETVQDEGTDDLTDPDLQGFLEAILELGDKAPLCMITTRRVPRFFQDQKTHFHHQLQSPIYGDFLRFIKELKLTQYITHEELQPLHRKLYKVFGGNFMGLQFYLAALKDMSREDGADFLQRIEQKASEELATYTALAELFSQLNEEEKQLLIGSTILPHAVIAYLLHGIALGSELENDTSLEHLSQLSLIDRKMYQGEEFLYQISPFMGEWLQSQGHEPTKEQWGRGGNWFMHLYDKNKKFAWIQLAKFAFGYANNIEMEGCANISIIGYYLQRGLHDHALKLCNENLEIENSNLKSTFLSSKAHILSIQGKKNEAEAVLNHSNSLTINPEFKLLPSITRVTAYIIQQEFETASKEIAILEKSEDSLTKAYAKYFQFFIYVETNDYDNAMLVYDDARKGIEAQGEEQFSVVASIHSFAVQLFFKNKKIHRCKSAIQDFFKYYAVAQPIQIANVYIALGLILAGERQENESLQCLKEAYWLASKVSDNGCLEKLTEITREVGGLLFLASQMKDFTPSYNPFQEIDELGQ